MIADGGDDVDGTMSGSRVGWIRRHAGDDRARTWLQRSLVAVPLLAYAALGWAWRWIVDDGFVYLRVVQQVRAGNGPVFNAGERVEVYTSPLWTALLVIGDVATPVRSEIVATSLGVALAVTGLALAMAAAATLADDPRRSRRGEWIVPFGALVPIALVPFWLFQSSGLETGLTFAWLGASVLTLARWSASDRPVHGSVAVLLGLGVLVRPDLGVFSVAFVATVAILDGRRWSRRVGVVALAAAIPMAYQLFRMAYFGAIVSNSSIAKSPAAFHWGRGWAYLRDAVEPYHLWFPLLIIVVAGYVPTVQRCWRDRDHRRTAVVLVCGVAGVLHGGYVISIGGDWIHARLLLPSIFAVLLPVAVVRVRASAPTRRHLAVAVVVGWAMLVGFVVRAPHLDPEYPFTERVRLTVSAQQRGSFTIDDLGFGDRGPRREWYEGPALYVTRSFGTHRRIDREPLAADVPLPALVTTAIGLVPFAIGPELHVIDRYGLADPLTARLDLAGAPDDPLVRAGHEKRLPSVWLAAMVTADGSRPDPEIYPSHFAPLIEPARGADFHEQVAWARAALECPDLADLDGAVRAPLSLGRIVRNVVGSVSRTRLSVPPDPREAYRVFCGDDVPEQVRDMRSVAGDESSTLSRDE